MPKVRGPEVPGVPVDCSARVEQAEFPPSDSSRLRHENFQPNRHVLLVRRVVLVHHDHVVIENTHSASARAASFELAAQALLSGDFDIHIMVLPSSDVPSDPGGGVYQLDSRDGAQDRPRGVVLKASAVEPAADHLAVRQEGGGLVGGGRHRPRPQDRQCGWRDRSGDPLDGHRRRPEGILQALDRQHTERRVRDREVRESACDFLAESRSPGYSVPRVTHQDPVIQR